MPDLPPGLFWLKQHAGFQEAPPYFFPSKKEERGGTSNCKTTSKRDHVPVSRLGWEQTIPLYNQLICAPSKIASCGACNTNWWQLLPPSALLNRSGIPAGPRPQITAVSVGAVIQFQAREQMFPVPCGLVRTGLPGKTTQQQHRTYMHYFVKGLSCDERLR